MITKTRNDKAAYNPGAQSNKESNNPILDSKLHNNIETINKRRIKNKFYIHFPERHCTIFFPLLSQLDSMLKRYYKHFGYNIKEIKYSFGFNKSQKMEKFY